MPAAARRLRGTFAFREKMLRESYLFFQRDEPIEFLPTERGCRSPSTAATALAVTWTQLPQTVTIERDCL
jgi:hypothetical protein